MDADISSPQRPSEGQGGGSNVPCGSTPSLATESDTRDNVIHGGPIPASSNDGCVVTESEDELVPDTEWVSFLPLSYLGKIEKERGSRIKVP